MVITKFHKKYLKKGVFDIIDMTQNIMELDLDQTNGRKRKMMNFLLLKTY